MKWLHFEAFALSSVILAGLALLGICVIIALIAYWTHYKKKKKCQCGLDKRLLIAGRKDKDANTTVLVRQKDQNEDLENKYHETNMVQAGGPQVFTAGVGSLRQVSLSILYDLLLSLTSVRLKMARPDKKDTGKPSNIPSSVECETGSDDFRNTFQRMPLTPTHAFASSNEGFVFQEGILQDILKEDLHYTGKPKSFEDEYTNVEKPNCEIPTYMSEAEMTHMLRDYVNKQLDYIFADDSRRHETFCSIAEAMVGAPTAQLLVDAMYRIFRVTHEVLREWGIQLGSLEAIDPSDTSGDVSLKVDFATNSVVIQWDGSVHGSDLLSSASRLVQMLREERIQPTYSEYITVHLALYRLTRGYQISHLDYQPLGSPGFATTPGASISLTDPGKGHVICTSRSQELLKGTVVNVEHHHGDNNSTTDMIDQRVPPLLNFAQVRLHVGTSAPTTYFIGKALKVDFEEAFDKDINMAACAATTAFSYGAAECKVCVCGLRSSQALRFLTMLRLKIQRHPNQILCAVWNLNRPILDDRGHEVVERRTRQDIVNTALDVTSRSGLDTLAFCGATTDSPNEDIVSQLGFAEVLRLTHEAHTLGLRVQFSTGSSSSEVTNAVLTGADVISVSNTRVLRNMDDGPRTDITSTISTRDKAAQSTRGRGVHILSRLDTMFFEGSITESQNAQRQNLFHALQDKCDKDIKNILKTLSDVASLPSYSDRLEGTTRRLLTSNQSLLKDELGYHWEGLSRRLRAAVEEMDHDALLEEYKSEPWNGCRLRFWDKYGIAASRK